MYTFEFYKIYDSDANFVAYENYEWIRVDTFKRSDS